MLQKALVKESVVDLENRLVAGFDVGVLQESADGLAVAGQGHDLELVGTVRRGQVGQSTAHEPALPGNHRLDELMRVAGGFHGHQAQVRYQTVGAPEFGQCIDAGGKRQQIAGRQGLFVEIRLFKFRPAANGE